jgi:hypothetical protein
MSRARAWFTACVFACACADPPAAPAAPALAPGLHVVGDAAALVRVAERAARLTGTPLGNAAARALERLKPCASVAWGSAPSLDALALLDALACGDPPAPLAAMRADAVAVRALTPEGVSFDGRATVDAQGGLALEGALAGTPPGGARLLVPGDDPGPAVLAGGALAHARVRPAGGLDLASLVSNASQADTMFRLKSGLFSGSVLDGTWELAVYPADGMPRAALALGHRSSAAAVAAIEGFITDLRATWSFHRAPFELAGEKGACLPELNLLPELAPCYLARDHELVVGWNEASVRAALAGAPDDAAGYVLHVDRFPPEDAVRALWRTVRVSGTAAKLRVELVASD